MHAMDSNAHIRIARPSTDLSRAERFWVNGVGMDVLFRHEAATDSEEHSLLMVGRVGDSWHLELTHNHNEPPTPSPTADDLLVIYLGHKPSESLIGKIKANGGKPVPAHNPYWDRWGATVEDPDGYRLVLCERTWTNKLN